MRTSILIACGINAPAVFLCLCLCFPQPDTVFRFVYLIIRHLFFSPLCSCCGNRTLKLILRIVCPFSLLFIASFVNTWYRYEDIQEYWIVLRDPMVYGKREILLLGRNLIEFVIAIIGNIVYLLSFRIYILSGKVNASLSSSISATTTAPAIPKDTGNHSTQNNASTVPSVTGTKSDTGPLPSLPSSPLTPQSSPLSPLSTSTYSSPVKQSSPSSSSLYNHPATVPTYQPPQPAIPALYSPSTVNSSTSYGFLNTNPNTSFPNSPSTLDNGSIHPLHSPFNPSSSTASVPSSTPTFMYPSFSSLIASSSSSSSSSSVQSSNSSTGGLRQRNIRQLGVGSNAPAFSQDIYGPSKPRLGGVVSFRDDGRWQTDGATSQDGVKKDNDIDDKEDIEGHYVPHDNNIETDESNDTKSIDEQPKGSHGEETKEQTRPVDKEEKNESQKDLDVSE